MDPVTNPITNVFDWRPTPGTVFLNLSEEPSCDILSVAETTVHTFRDPARAPNGPCVVYGKNNHSPEAQNVARVARVARMSGGCFSVARLAQGLEYMLLDNRFEFRNRTQCEMAVTRHFR